ncbi:hypothetical protein [Streptomyces venezuelae]
MAHAPDRGGCAGGALADRHDVEVVTVHQVSDRTELVLDER